MRLETYASQRYYTQSGIGVMRLQKKHPRNYCMDRSLAVQVNGTEWNETYPNQNDNLKLSGCGRRPTGTNVGTD